MDQSDSDAPAPFGRCAQCNGEKRDAPLLVGFGSPPADVYLHAECRKFWLARQESRK
jgi:hypothetical protein